MLLLGGCSNAPYKGGEVLGADEFVIDSYKIKEGKFSILEMEGLSLTPLDPDLLREYADTVENGDTLELALYDLEQGDLAQAVQSIGASVGYTVRDGHLHLPDLPAPVKVGGLTLTQAQEKIQKAYDHEQEDVEVFVSFKNRAEQKVELAGMVSIPAVPIDGKVRLFEVLSKARVPTDANLFKSYMVRHGSPVPVDMYKLVKQGDMSQNVVMRGGDKIYIAESAASSLMVMGEVRDPRVIHLPGGSLSLREALALAGGMTHSGDRRYIQVIRGNLLRPKIYTLNWNHVVRLPTSSLLVMPGDIVYVAATPIAEWSRFVLKVFPTLTGIQLFRSGNTAAGIVTAP